MFLCSSVCSWIPNIFHRTMVFLRYCATKKTIWRRMAGQFTVIRSFQNINVQSMLFWMFKVRHWKNHHLSESKSNAFSFFFSFKVSTHFSMPCTRFEVQNVGCLFWFYYFGNLFSARLRSLWVIKSVSDHQNQAYFQQPAMWKWSPMRSLISLNSSSQIRHSWHLVTWLSQLT